MDFITRTDEYPGLYQEALDKAVPQGEILIIKPEYIAAMKMATRRRKDEADLLFMLRQPGLVDRGVVLDIVRRHVGGRFGVDEMRSLMAEADYGIRDDE